MSESSNNSDSDYAEFSSDDEGVPGSASHNGGQPDEPPSLVRQTSGQMDPTDVATVMQLKVDSVHEVLSISKEECRLLLEFLHWDEEQLKAKFLDSEAEVRESHYTAAFEANEHPFDVTTLQLRKIAGVTRGSCPPAPPLGVDCLDECPCTLDDDIPWADADALPCGHWMSKAGWHEFMHESAARGPSMVLQTCFSSGCIERVRLRMFKDYLSPAEFVRYQQYALASFVQEDRHLVQCVGPDCDQVIQIMRLQAHDVECRKCGTVFCSSCSAEGHQPATCQQVRMWDKKNSDEGENMTWIQANTKPCPKCHVNIEKNQGCNHMTCRKGTGGCGHEFCWLCLGDYRSHSGCKPPEDLAKRQQAASAKISHFMRFFNPYHNHNEARKHAKKLRVRLRQQHWELVQHKKIPLREADVLLRAVDAVLSGRRVLMYTHVFAFYCKNKSELALFEHMQEQLNINNERVLEMLELEGIVQRYLERRTPEELRTELFEYIAELRNFTELSLKFMSEMLQAVQDGLLDDVAAVEQPTHGAAAAAAGGARGPKGGGNGGHTFLKRGGGIGGRMQRLFGKSSPRRGGSTSTRGGGSSRKAQSSTSAAGVPFTAQEEARELQVAQLMSLGHVRSLAEAALESTTGDLAAAEQLLAS